LRYSIVESDKVSSVFISNLFTAAKIYFESKNISAFKLEDFVKVMRFAACRQVVSSSPVYKSLSNQIKCNPRDVSGYLSLAWHLGILAIHSYDKSSGFTYIATGIARELAELCRDPHSNQCLEMLRKLFLRWEPLRVLLKFLRSRGTFRSRDVVKVLGEEMRFWNSKLIELGLPVERGKSGAPRKPFNDFVVRKLFKPLLDELQLHSIVPEERGYTVVKSRSGEPVIAAGIAHVVSSYRESILVTPFIDEYGVELIIKALALTPEPKHVELIVRKPSPRVNLNELKVRARDMGSEIEVHITKRPLHAKIYSSRNEVLITSANLLKTSLLRNVEIGIAIQGRVYEVEGIVLDLVYGIQRGNSA